MKKITLLVLFCSFFYLAKASVILDETFDYAVANLTDELTWTHSGTITTGTGRNIEAGGLVYSNEGGTYIFSGIGKKINHDYSAGSNYISYKTFPAVSSGVIYLSYLYQANGDQGQTASEVLGLAYATNNSAVKPWVGKQADQTKNPFRMGITRSSTSSGDIQWGASTLDKNNVYLIVVKYDFSTLKASLFVNPVIASAEEPVADASDDALGTARTSLSYLCSNTAEVLWLNSMSAGSESRLHGLKLWPNNLPRLSWMLRQWAPQLLFPLRVLQPTGLLSPMRWAMM